MALYGNSSREVELLRKFRDKVLSKTSAGQEVIRLYYKWSPMIVEEMKADINIKMKVKEIVDKILPLVGGAIE